MKRTQHTHDADVVGNNSYLGVTQASLSVVVEPPCFTGPSWSGTRSLGLLGVVMVAPEGGCC